VWWVVLAGVFVYAVPHDLHGGIAFAIMLGLAALGLAPMPLLARSQDRRRSARIATGLSRNAFAVDTHPGDGERRDVLARLGPLALLGSNPEHIRWIARTSIRGREVTVLRHSRLVGGGVYWYEKAKIVVALPIDDPRPGIWLIRTNSMSDDGQDDTGGRPRLRFGDSWFDRSFRIHSHDPDSLTRILTPAVREFIASGPSQESWTVSDGYVVCVLGGDTSARGIGVMIQRAQRMTELLMHKPTV
jgi:hypothetical protein